MVVYAGSVRVTFLPIAYIVAAVKVDEAALAACHVVTPVSFINGSVFPHLDAFSVSLVSRIPLAFIYDAFVYENGRLVNYTLVVILIVFIYVVAALLLGSNGGFVVPVGERI